ncbi:MAG: hypothetical protein A2Y57_03195 [Candidatus Woykebacteria bacterium RBG_13_40_7b]|uniref:SCP domain-containing protein n=1 Tax=Candidatus Woykebacteria bacterium RBG_13_40_7b TaxID=1802594 RepID=A0A1G1W621_9BACT|nr:MAG: hypothetical protein A2Y57_03195 [Candidatus Woykebacteria bacterium RBG_13_40_7b]
MHNQKPYNRRENIVWSVILLSVLVGAMLIVGFCTEQKDTPEDALIRLISDYRAENYLDKLDEDKKLTEIACWMANDLANNNQDCNWNYKIEPNCHTDSLDRGTFQRACDLGVCGNIWYGEDLYAGSIEPEDVLRELKESPKHNEVLLGPNYTYIGVCVSRNPKSHYGYYWAVELANTEEASVQ